MPLKHHSLTSRWLISLGLYSKLLSLLSLQRYPEYYEVIPEPIDLKTIGMRIVNGDYTALTQCEDDLNLMCKNAMTFNEPGSQVWTMALKL